MKKTTVLLAIGLLILSGCTESLGTTVDVDEAASSVAGQLTDDSASEVDGDAQSVAGMDEPESQSSDHEKEIQYTPDPTAPQPDDVEYFDDDAGKGFLDPDGNRVVLSDRYDEFFKFYDGRLVVFNRVEEGAYGNPYYIWDMGVLDEYGNEVIEPGSYISQFNREHYSNGYLSVRTTSGYMGAVDKEGNYVLEPIYRTIHDEIIGNRRVISRNENGRLMNGYVDEHYNMVIPFSYETAQRFSEVGANAYAFVFPTYMRVYEEDYPTMEVMSDYLFNYAIIDVNNNALFDQPQLVYCNFETYQILRAHRENNEYPVFDFDSMTSTTMNLNGKWTFNYNISSFQETDPKYLWEITDACPVDVYIWDEDTVYEVKSLEDLQQTAD